ncbi:uncharacterized protein [Hetaerina americana]|uniref:uncharacterized protein n=1 Tax=Hetaerina americana TaxID=62018 RepID=UPI003A7F5333
MATKNIEDLCRVCVQESHSYKHIYSDCIEDDYIYEVMNALCNLGICHSDGLPEYICNECFHKVLGFHKFQKTCHDGKTALISIKMKYSTEMVVNPMEIKSEVFIDEIDCNRYECSKEEPEDLATTEDCDLVVHTQVEAVLSNPDETNDQQLSSPKETDESYKTVKGEEGASIHPVGLVKCPREQVAVDSTLRFAHVSGRSPWGQEVDDATGCSDERVLPSIEAPLQPESAMRNGPEEYQFAGDKPDFSQNTALNLVCPPRDRSRPTLDPCEPPFVNQVDGFIIKRIYKGTEEDLTDSLGDMGGVPYMGRGHDKASRTGYKCPHCGKSISRRFDFESHLRIHSGIKPFECHICHATFNLKKRLKAHMNVHSAMKLFICAHCQRKFKSKDALRLHIYVHMGEKLPERPSKASEVWCKVCGVSVLESCLAYHMRVHARELVCEVCGEMCRDVDAVNEHKRVHNHDKKFQCTKCGKRYGLKGNLVQHMLVHTNDRRFSCKTCSRSFYTSSRLRRHEETHSSERKVQCNICSRAFKTKHYLYQHLKTHRNSEPLYKCGTCGQKYKWRGDLRKHCKTKNHPISL